MLTRREDRDTYLTPICRHPCSVDSQEKRWNMRSFQPTLWLSSAIDIGWYSRWKPQCWLKAPHFSYLLCAIADTRMSTDRCRSLPFLLTFLIRLSICINRFVFWSESRMHIVEMFQAHGNPYQSKEHAVKFETSECVYKLDNANVSEPGTWASSAEAGSAAVKQSARAATAPPQSGEESRQFCAPAWVGIFSKPGNCILFCNCHSTASCNGCCSWLCCDVCPRLSHRPGKWNPH